MKSLVAKVNWRSRWRGLALFHWLVAAFLITAQARQPVLIQQGSQGETAQLGDPEAIRQGRILFNRDCSPCHGSDARGGRGPDLASGRSTHGDSDATLFGIISKGVAGTEMPGSSYKDDEIRTIIAFLRSLAASTAANTSERPAGNPEAGKKRFAEMCSQCHQVERTGGRLGPNLSRIGAARSIGYLTESIRHASKDVPRKYETVTAITKDGQRVIGVRLNEDTFSLQLMDQEERLHSWLKKDLRDVIYEQTSLMPDYSENMLGQKELQNLLAYLANLRGQEKR